MHCPFAADGVESAAIDVEPDLVIVCAVYRLPSRRNVESAAVDVDDVLVEIVFQIDTVVNGHDAAVDVEIEPADVVTAVVRGGTQLVDDRKVAAVNAESTMESADRDLVGFNNAAKGDDARLASL